MSVEAGVVAGVVADVVADLKRISIEEKLAALFRLADTDGSETLDAEEVRILLRQANIMNELQRKSIWNALDLNRDRSVSLEEFRQGFGNDKTWNKFHLDDVLEQDLKSSRQVIRRHTIEEALVSIKADEVALVAKSLRERTELLNQFNVHLKEFMAGPGPTVLIEKARERAELHEGLLHGKLMEQDFVSVCGSVPGIKSVLSETQYMRLFLRLADGRQAGRPGAVHRAVVDAEQLIV